MDNVFCCTVTILPFGSMQFCFLTFIPTSWHRIEKSKCLGLSIKIFMPHIAFHVLCQMLYCQWGIFSINSHYWSGNKSRVVFITLLCYGFSTIDFEVLHRNITPNYINQIYNPLQEQGTGQNGISFWSTPGQVWLWRDSAGGPRPSPGSSVTVFQEYS